MSSSKGAPFCKRMALAHREDEFPFVQHLRSERWTDADKIGRSENNPCIQAPALDFFHYLVRLSLSSAAWRRGGTRRRTAGSHRGGRTPASLFRCLPGGSRSGGCSTPGSAAVFSRSRAAGGEQDPQGISIPIASCAHLPIASATRDGTSSSVRARKSGICR